VLTENDCVMGYCRVDAGLVSIAIDPSAHGKGYGKKLLNSAISEALRRWPIVTAEVLADNAASRRLFTTNGFTLVREAGESILYQINR
jgi:ribosomal protein S18 acetylase RimI-like enzyme